MANPVTDDGSDVGTSTDRLECALDVIGGQEVYHEPTRLALQGDGEVGRWLAGTAESGHDDNVDYRLCGTLSEAMHTFTDELNGEYVWSPVTLVDLDTGRDYAHKVRLVAIIDEREEDA